MKREYKEVYYCGYHIKRHEFKSNPDGGYYHTEFFLFNNNFFFTNKVK